MGPLVLFGAVGIAAYLLLQSFGKKTPPAQQQPQCAVCPPCPPPPAGQPVSPQCQGLDANMPADLCAQVQQALGGNNGVLQCQLAQQVQKYPLAFSKLMAACQKNRLT